MFCICFATMVRRGQGDVKFAIFSCPHPCCPKRMTARTVQANSTCVEHIHLTQTMDVLRELERTLQFAQWPLVVLQQKNPSWAQKAFLCRLQCVNLLTGHLDLKARSVVTLYIINFSTMKVQYLQNFPKPRKAISMYVIPM